MNSEISAEPPKTKPEIVKATPKQKKTDPKLLEFPVGGKANTQSDLDDMWDNLPV